MDLSLKCVIWSTTMTRFSPGISFLFTLGPQLVTCRQSFTGCYSTVWLAFIPFTHFVCTLSLLCTGPLWPSSPVTSVVWSFSSPSLKYESDELEKSVYQDYDSDSDVADELKQDYVDEQTGDAPLKRSVPSRIVSHCSGDMQLRVWHVVYPGVT